MDDRAPSFFGAVARGFRLSFKFTGRDTRAEFWPFVFVCVLIPSVAELIVSQVRIRQIAAAYPNLPQDMMEGRVPEGALDNIIESGSYDPFPLAWITISAAAIIAIPYLSAITRRFHDIGMRGWWVLPKLILVGAAWFVDLHYIRNPEIFGTPQVFDYVPISIFLTIFASIWTLVLFYFAILDGDYGSNHFGEDPKGRILTK